MESPVFINLAVKGLTKSMEFYNQLGFTNNPQFTDDTAGCMVLSEEIYVMLLTHPKFKEFTKKDIGDTFKIATVINSLSVDSNEEVNTMVEKALNAGGKEPNEAKDFGFMQQRSFEDLDGHLWEVLYMDVSKFPQQQ